MALLLDEAHWHWRGRMWCHLVSDHSLDELHAFAVWIGMPRRAFQGDHYDIPEEARPIAIEEGALVVTSREIVLAPATEYQLEIGWSWQVWQPEDPNETPPDPDPSAWVAGTVQYSA